MRMTYGIHISFLSLCLAYGLQRTVHEEHRLPPVDGIAHKCRAAAQRLSSGTFPFRVQASKSLQAELGPIFP